VSPRGPGDRHEADGDPLQRFVRNDAGVVVRVVAWLVIAALVLGGAAVLVTAITS